MAPSITENVSLQAPTASAPLKTDAGHNKENLIGYKYLKEAELRGTNKLPPASFPHYLPVWDNETERYALRSRSIDRIVLPLCYLTDGLMTDTLNRYPPLTIFEH